MNSRDITHLSHAGISIGVDVSDGKARIAFAFCKSSEPFSRKGGRHVINLRFDGADAVLNNFNIRRNLLEIDYDGVRPRKDILFPIADHIRNELGFKLFYDVYENGTKEQYYPPGTEYNEDLETFFIPTDRVQRSVNSLRRTIREFVKQLDVTPKEEKEVLASHRKQRAAKIVADNQRIRKRLPRITEHAKSLGLIEKE